MKWITGLIIALLLVGGATYWYQTQDVGNGKAIPPDSLLAQIPADTLYVLRSQNSAELAEFMSSTYIGGTPGQYAMLIAEGVEVTADSDSPFGRFFHYLLTQYQSQHDGTVTSLFEFLGLEFTGESAIYSHGITPVFKATMKDEQKLLGLLDAAAQNSGFTHETLTLGGHKVRAWPLQKAAAENDPQYYLALLTKPPFATLTILNKQSPLELQEQRLGLRAPESSLQDSGELDEVINRHGLLPEYAGFFHLDRLAKAFADAGGSLTGADGSLTGADGSLTGADGSLAGRELMMLIDKVKTLQDDPASDLDTGPDTESLQTCAQDYQKLTQFTPHLAMGYTATGFKADHFDMDFKVALEIENQDVRNELQKIRGHINEHALNADDNILGLGYGVNFDTLTASLTNLWTRFTQLQFNCPSLVKYQEQIKSTHPMMLGMFVGMVQGIKGISFSLHDIEFADSFVPSGVSALLSITSENPAAVAALTAMSPLPELANLEIPNDGTAVAVPVMMLPPSIEVKAAIKGKHLAIYTGETAAKKAEALSGESTQANGVFAMSVNYNKLNALVSNNSITAMTPFGSTDEGCSSQLDLAEAFSQLYGKFDLLTDHTDMGWQMAINASAQLPAITEHTVIGAYTVETMNDFCQWQIQGRAQVGDDSEGDYRELSFSGECALYQEARTWNQKGARLDINVSSTQRRSQCSDAFEDEPAGDSATTCFMTQVKENQFVCRFADPSTHSALRYTRNTP